MRSRAHGRGAAVVAVAAMVVLVAAGCDDGGPPRSRGADPGVPTTGGVTPSPDASQLPAPTVRPLPDSIAVAPLPPELVERWQPALFGSADIGVPDDWVIRDLDAALAASDPAIAADADPLQQMVSCPTGSLPAADADWLSRRFTAPSNPLENGLLTVEIMLEALPDEAAPSVSSTAASAPSPPPASTVADRPVVDGWLAGCAVAVGTSVVAQDGSPARYLLTAEPSATRPYPAALAVAAGGNADTRVIVVFAGIDLGADWRDDATELVDRVLTTLG